MLENPSLIIHDAFRSVIQCFPRTETLVDTPTLSTLSDMAKYDKNVYVEKNLQNDNICV